jgi:hypothetical protein
MQSISEFNPTRKRGPFCIAYRYIPGSLETDSSLNNGAIMTQEFRLRKSRAKRLAELSADPKIQWCREIA